MKCLKCTKVPKMPKINVSFHSIDINLNRSAAGDPVILGTLGILDILGNYTPACYLSA